MKPNFTNINHKFTINKVHADIVNLEVTSNNIPLETYKIYKENKRAYTELCMNEIGYYIVIKPVPEDKENSNSVIISLYKNNTLLSENKLLNTIFLENNICTNIIKELINQAYTDYNKTK